MLVIPASELGLARGCLECNVGDERPVAARLESLEGLVKKVVEKINKMEAQQPKQQCNNVLQPSFAHQGWIFHFSPPTSIL